MTITMNRPERNDAVEPRTGLKPDYVADVIGPGLNEGWTIWTQNGRCITVDATKDPNVWQERQTESYDLGVDG
jgi:hypothetical protein